MFQPGVIRQSSPPGAGRVQHFRRRRLGEGGRPRGEWAEPGLLRKNIHPSIDLMSNIYIHIFLCVFRCLLVVKNKQENRGGGGGKSFFPLPVKQDFFQRENMNRTAWRCIFRSSQRLNISHSYIYVFLCHTRYIRKNPRMIREI